MLQKTAPIIVEAAPAEVVVTESIAPYELFNHDPGVGYWHLVTGDEQGAMLRDSAIPNFVCNVMALTKEVADELRAISNKVRLISANPADDLELCDSLVAQRFALSITMPEGDPKSYAQWLLTNYAVDQIAAGDVSTQNFAEVMVELCEHISWFANAFERETIAKDIARIFKSSKATVGKQINDFIRGREDNTTQHVDEGEAALPAWLSNDREKRDFYYLHGWVPLLDGFGNTGFYFLTSNGPKQLTNFVLVPLIHIYTKDEMGNRRLTELNNGMIKPVIELPGKAFTSMEVFDSIVTNEGYFVTKDGFTKSHLNRLKTYYLGEYPKCFELTTLGWQPEGFFSFSDLIYKNALIEYNPYGYAEVDGQNYLSMGASNTLDGVRADDDIYKNDKYLSYKESSITFEGWCRLMVGVYPEHGMMAITFVMMTIFRDVLFKRNNNFPMLYAYGPVGSGKSQFGASIANFFTSGMPMFNLSNGTDFAFFSLLSRFNNVAVGLNEFDENSIRENWFTAIKGIYDGEGREKGTGKRNKTTSQAINVAIVLIGQFLSTKDDNSVLSRTLPCKITENSERTPEQIALYNELKGHEQKGVSALICELLAHRRFVIDKFITRFGEVTSELKAEFNREGITPKNRIMENFTVALAMASLMGEKFQLGFTYETFFKHCKAEITKLNSVMAESNSLSQFWKTVEFLLDQNVIEQGNHYRVETMNQVRILVDRKPVYKTFDEPKKLLFLRLSTIHMLYATEIRRQTGKSGQNEQTIITYMKDQASYIGSNPASMFAHGTNTSSYVFDYDQLGVNLERFKSDNQPSIELIGKVYRDAEITDIIGTPKLTFTLLQDESYTDGEGNKVKKEIITNCTSEQNQMIHHLKKGREIKVTGTMVDQKGSNAAWRRMGVTNIELVEAELPLSVSDAVVDEVFGKEGVV
jgi:hypothetical protein